MSLAHSVLRFVKGPAKQHGRRPVAVTTYEVIDDDFVEGVTATESGQIVVVIRRGSLELPSPSNVAVSTAETSGAAFAWGT